MGTVTRRIGEYFLALALCLSLVTLAIVAEHDYSYTPAAFANALALYIMEGIGIVGVWFNMVWESEDDD